LKHAHYELIDDEEPFCSEVPELQGAWARGRSLEECRQNLAEVIDDGVLARSSHDLATPPLDEVQITPPRAVKVV